MRRKMLCLVSIVLILGVCATACLLAGCGKDVQGNPDGSLVLGQTGNETPDPQWRYKAEPLEMGSDPLSYAYAELKGEYVYYCLYSDNIRAENQTCHMYKYAISDDSTKQLPVAIRNGSIPFYDIGENGDIYAFVYYRKENQGTEEGGEENGSEARLEKYDADGNRIYSTDIGDLPEDNRFFQMAADGEGRVYFYYNRQIACFDGQGNSTGNIELPGGAQSAVAAMCRGGDGDVYACVTRDVGSSALVKLDFAKRSAEVVMENFVSCAKSGLCAGWEEHTLLAQDGSILYEYDLENKNWEALLRWTDSGLNGDQILSVGAVPEGKIFAAQGGTANREGGVFLLRRLSDEEVPQKEEIVLATDVVQLDMNGYKVTDTLLVESVLAFNNASDKYHITIKEYGNDLQAASTKLDLDLVSGNGPDIIYGFLVYREKSLTEKGVLEDLGPWLEQSTVIGREDFLDHTLDGCIFDGKLVTLPQSFNLYTIIGRASDVGEDMGWTIEELMAMQEKHPKAQLFSRGSAVSKTGTLRKCLTLCMENFVDWDAGKCSFDSPEFVQLLEFINRYGDVEADDYTMYANLKLHRGDVLLAETSLTDFEERQYYDGVFEGESCVVGYPTKNGEPASFIQPGVRCCITAASEHKEGAWAFLESLVTYPTQNIRLNYVNVPAIRARFDEYLEKLLAQEEKELLAYDDKLAPILDEEGKQAVLGVGLHARSFGSMQDGYVIIRALTQEDVDWFMDILRVARVQPPEQEDIEKILFEEADYFFNGAKSVQEVADIIQNRVQLYLNEG